MPGLRRREIGTDVAGAALYVVNWVFAHRAVDYLASDSIPSPVQHFWSLAVEEQFYVVWPLALIALALVLRRLGRRPSAGCRWACLLAAIAVPSFGYAVWLGARRPRPRVLRHHDAGLGAGGRRGARGLVRGPGGAAAARRAGDGAHAAYPWRGRCSAGRGWPPSSARRPGCPPGRRRPGPGRWCRRWGRRPSCSPGWLGAPHGPVRVLGTAPMVWIGGLSYSHLPLALAGPGADRVGVRRDHDRPAGRSCWSLLAACRPGPSHRFAREPDPPQPGPGRAHPPGARPRGSPCRRSGRSPRCRWSQAASPFRTTPVAGARPAVDDPRRRDPHVTAEHRPRGLRRRRLGSGSPRTRSSPARTARPPTSTAARSTGSSRSRWPASSGSRDGPTTVALVGDSKAMQWLPALERLAPAARLADRDLRQVRLRARRRATPRTRAAPYPACDEWNRRVMERLRADPPDLLLTSGYAASAWDGARRHRGRRWWRAWPTAGRSCGRPASPVVVLGDSPLSPDDLDVCTARHPHELSRCAFDRAPAVAGSGLPAQREAAALLRARRWSTSRPGSARSTGAPWRSAT